MLINQPRSRILRQRFSMAFLQLDVNKRYICIDQSWLNMSDFRLRKWTKPSSNFTVGSLNVNPRTSIHLAIDNFGRSWVSILNCNSNRQVFQLTLRHLIERLNLEDPDWRSNTVLILDGASYHQADSSKDLINKLQISVLMLGPYSYTSSPCELWFAALKKADLNPRHVKTGKMHFQNVIDMVVNRCNEIPRHHIILFWHHCMAHVYRYLDFNKI